MADVAAHDQHGQGKFTLLNDPEDSEKCPSDCPIAEQEQPEEPEYSTTSADQVLFLRFFEEIESCVAQAEALWRRVALTELDLSTASILTSLYIPTDLSRVWTLYVGPSLKLAPNVS
ncbi:hypothetical protein COCVIDRAFT_22111 [Bipolaris victoriae FI3]|uniref:Uncharacterized protein n=1 Tax=Bipolaris victoriae (strain FI3) TaxID=930091 RepID=W7F289_BIPV3|nr:hypothetical protein COCVIDRAFT_22111 [Bipolaris victoriae FI3]